MAFYIGLRKYLSSLQAINNILNNCLILFHCNLKKSLFYFLGLITYADGSHGFPRNEGFFQDCRLLRRQRSPSALQKTRKICMMARAQNT